MRQASAEPALRKFIERSFHAWDGLAPGTSLADIAAVCDVDQGWRGSGVLGEERRPAEWVNAELDGYDEAVRVWLEGDTVLLMDVESPPIAGEPAALLAQLGPPQATLDSYLGTFLLRGSEQVWPRRGLTLYVNPENGLLLRLAVYAPTTLAAYRRSLRLDLEMRRLPSRRASQ